MAPQKSTVVACNFVQKDGFNLSCQLCGHNFTGTLTRAVDHLLGISNGSGGGVEPCTKITDEQKATVQKDHSNSQMQKKKRGYVPPGSEALRTTLLKRAKGRVTGKLADIKESWKLTRCTILSDGWSDLCHCPLINVLVYCPQGVLFLKAINAMDRVKTSEFIFGILDEAIREVGVANVVHVTDNASNCVGAGKLIMEKYNQIYWTPCAAHCLDLMLHDLAKFPWVNETIRRAKTISNFIINHRLTLSIYRKNASKELLRPCDTRFATFYITLKRVVEEKASLRAVFCNTEWERCTLSKETKGKKLNK
eukprot:PITA_32271